MQSAAHTFILAVDGYVGRDDVVIGPLADIKPKGIAGATLSGDGLVVLVLTRGAARRSAAKQRTRCSRCGVTAPIEICGTTQ